MVSGMGPDFGTKALQQALTKGGLQVDSVTWKEGGLALQLMLASRKYSTCIIPGLGCGTPFKSKQPCFPFPESGPLRCASTAIY
jgi:hypothetical protein